MTTIPAESIEDLVIPLPSGWPDATSTTYEVSFSDSADASSGVWVPTTTVTPRSVKVKAGQGSAIGQLSPDTWYPWLSYTVGGLRPVRRCGPIQIIGDEIPGGAPDSKRITLGMLADEVPALIEALAVTAAQPLGQYELVPVYADGHSFVQGTGSTVAGGRFWERIVRRLSMGGNVLAAVSGTRIGLHSLTVMGGPLAYVLNSKRMPIVCCATNDAAGGASAPVQFGFTLAWRAYLAAITARAAVAANSTSFVYSAGWTTEAVATSTGGTRFVTTTPGSYCRFSYTDDGRGVDVFFAAKPGGAGLITFTEGATVLGTLNLTAATLDDCSAVFKLRGLSVGNHTITATLTSGASMTVDGYRIPSYQPVPGVIVSEGVRRTDIATPDGSTQNTVLVNVIKPSLAAVVAEFPSMMLVDLAALGWDPETMCQDALHPNDVGATFIASEAIKIMRQRDFGQALNVLRHEDDIPAYTSPTAPATPSGGQNGLGQQLGAILDLTVAGASTAGSQAALSWGPPFGSPAITDYTIQYRTTAGPGAWTPFAHTASTARSATVTGLTNGVSYDFRVQAVDGSGLLPWSNIVTATVSLATVYDDFNRADGAPGSTPIGAKAWTTLDAASGGTFAIVGGKLTYTGVSSSYAFCTVDVAAANGTFEAVVSNQLFAFRVQDSGNYVAVVSSGGFWRISRRSAAGALTAVVTSTLAATAGDHRVKVICNGTSVSLFIDGVDAFGTPQAVNFFTTSTKAGAYGTSVTGTTLDEFSYNTATS